MGYIWFNVYFDFFFGVCFDVFIRCGEFCCIGCGFVFVLSLLWEIDLMGVLFWEEVGLVVVFFWEVGLVVFFFWEVGFVVDVFLVVDLVFGRFFIVGRIFMIWDLRDLLLIWKLFSFCEMKCNVVYWII